jgi:hypothetical protein
MKLVEHDETGTTLEQLPELPDDIRVPDDISGLPPTPRPVDGRVRWIRWLAAIVMVGLVGVAFFLTQTEDIFTMDPMEQYGTDNAVVVDADAVPRSVVVTGSDQAIADAAYDQFELTRSANLYEDAVGVGGSVDYLERYGTDNPVIVGGETTPDPVDTMDFYGTDNPVPVDRTWMDRYGTDNPDFGG